ncbi:MAG: hypothetical protein IPG07_20765 [Crocinitomicaceae bacterium]|nr:hypothetical protein [Crocinitomicaceae bacterium]
MHNSMFNRAIAGFTVFTFLLFAFVSCSGDTWSADQKDTFLAECDAEGGSGSYCKCYLEKVMEKYPNHADSKNLDFESAVEMAKSCE